MPPLSFLIEYPKESCNIASLFCISNTEEHAVSKRLNSLFVICVLLLVGCAATATTTVEHTQPTKIFDTPFPSSTPETIEKSISSESPLATPSTDMDSTPYPAPENSIVTSTPFSSPSPVSIPGLPDKVTNYVATAKYLVPRLPSQVILDKWNQIEPPSSELVSAHKEFAASLEAFMQAHYEFNESAFGRSTTPVSQASDALEKARQDHSLVQNSFLQQLDQFLMTEYGIRLDDVPEMIIPLSQ